MFRPSQGTEVLNTGAMAVLTGAYNETNAKTANLAMAGNGGAFNTFSGVAWARPESSSVGRQIAVNADVLSQKGTGTTNFGEAQKNGSTSVKDPFQKKTPKQTLEKLLFFLKIKQWIISHALIF